MLYLYIILFFFKQKTAYEMRISDWSSDVCSSDLAIIAIDLTMAASSLVFAVSLRVSGALEPAVVQGLWVAAPLFALIAFGVFNTIGIYRRMWRYTSLADIFMVVQGVTLSICVLLIALLVLGRQIGRAHV